MDKLFRNFTYIGLLVISLSFVVTFLTLWGYTVRSCYSVLFVINGIETITDIIFVVFALGILMCFKEVRRTKILLAVSCVFGIVAVFWNRNIGGTIFNPEALIIDMQIHLSILLLLVFSEPLKWILFLLGFMRLDIVSKRMRRILRASLVVVFVTLIANILPLPSLPLVYELTGINLEPRAGVFVEPVYTMLLMVSFIMLIRYNSNKKYEYVGDY